MGRADLGRRPRATRPSAWRDRLFELRAEPKRGFLPAPVAAVADRVRGFIVPGGMGGGGQALNQLLVVMDGIDEPPLRKKFMTKKFNTFLDAMYIDPAALFGKKIRLKPPKPRKEQIYFIGACNVPLEALDPALIRPGRMGRHIYFRTPTWEDRRDVFDLYITKVAHEDVAGHAEGARRARPHHRPATRRR